MKTDEGGGPTDDVFGTDWDTDFSSPGANPVNTSSPTTSSSAATTTTTTTATVASSSTEPSHQSANKDDPFAVSSDFDDLDFGADATPGEI